jgi:hypothetical protein
VDEEFDEGALDEEAAVDDVRDAFVGAVSSISRSAVSMDETDPFEEVSRLEVVASSRDVDVDGVAAASGVVPLVGRASRAFVTSFVFGSSSRILVPTLGAARLATPPVSTISATAVNSFDARGPLAASPLRATPKTPRASRAIADAPCAISFVRDDVVATRASASDSADYVTSMDKGRKREETRGSKTTQKMKRGCLVANS